MTMARKRKNPHAVALGRKGGVVTFMLLAFVLSGCAGFQEWRRNPAVQEWARQPTPSRSMQCQTYYSGISASTHCW
jgi:hypothetical protein